MTRSWLAGRVLFPAVDLFEGADRSSVAAADQGEDRAKDEGAAMPLISPPPELKISVVVATYNSGDWLDGLVDSLLAQSMDASEFEVIVVDDGSTDGTGERVEELARTHPGFTAMRIPSSGWSGRPRNLGIAAARGRYVYVVDHDDWLEPEALDRLYERAERNDADVVVGREVGHGFGVPPALFRRNVDDARLGRDPLLVLLTPHKLFRRSLLVEHDIRFPEGRRRLEDHYFVMQAYFHARRISILADYPCYHWVQRDDRGNATHSAVDPAEYYESLRAVLDIVDEHTAPGAFRDRLYAHWYRSKVLHRLRGRRYVNPDEGALRLFDEVRRIALERFSPDVDRHLPVRYRVLSKAVRAGRVDAVAAIGRFGQELRADVRTTEIAPGQWTLGLRVEGALNDGTGEPLRFQRDGERVLWAAPSGLLDGLDLRPEDLDATDDLRAPAASFVFRLRGGGIQHDHVMRFSGLPEDAGVIRTVGELAGVVDLASLAGGEALPDGIWDITLSVNIAGWGANRRLPGMPLGPRDPERITEPFVTDRGNLSLRVMRPQPAESDDGPAPPVEDEPGVVEPPSRRASVLRRALRRVVPRPVRSLGAKLGSVFEG